MKQNNKRDYKTKKNNKIKNIKHKITYPNVIKQNKPLQNL